MKVGIITFHASHNYGSMLQAYALQQTVLSLGHQCEIINLRLPVQRKIYRPFFMQSGIRKKLKALRYPKLAIDDFRKYRLFEKFLREKYVLTSQEYMSSDELKAADLDFDCYISGSDQIWNTNCGDFSTAYYLDFVKSGKRIAYAPSMGPLPQKINPIYDNFIAEKLSKYEAISVREAGTANRIKEAVDLDSAIMADPTLLLSSEEWSSLAGSNPIVNGNYMLIYSPWYENYQELYEQAATFAEKHNLPVVCTTPCAYNRLHYNKYFKYYTAVGPLEFLNLIKYSRYVLCGSFHAVIFSLVFGRPFYAYNGMNDSRIAHILKTTSLEELTEISSNIPNMEYCSVHEKLKAFVNTSRLYLINAL